MRVILFRGKQKYNNDWIYGSLVRLGKESFSDSDRYGIIDKGIPIGNMNVCYNFRVEEIVPETISEFTGLTDKNDNKIFEGDIIKLYNGELRKVFFNEETLQWEMCFVNVKPCEVNHLINTQPLAVITIETAYGDPCSTEVIGNIWDNPDYIKEGESIVNEQNRRV